MNLNACVCVCVPVYKLAALGGFAADEGVAIALPQLTQNKYMSTSWSGSSFFI